MAKKAEKLAKAARLRCEKWQTYFAQNIDQYHRMHSFVLGKQWNNEEEDMLTSFNKVPLQFNKLATLVNTLLGEQQQNTPMLEVVPLSGCDEETANIRQLITKDIMLSNDAKTVYQVAAAQAFVGGFGAYYLSTDYMHPKSFDLDIKYCHFKDATRAYWDIGAEHVNKIDGMYCGYVSRMTRKKFRQMYGKEIESKILDSNAPPSEEEIAEIVAPQSDGNGFVWADSEGICILNDYTRKYEEETLYKMSNGKILNQEEMDALIESSKEIRAKIQQEQMMAHMMDALMGPEMGAEMGQQVPLEPTQEMDDDIMTLYDEGQPVRIEDRKESKKSIMIHRQFAGDFLLDETEFPSEDCPVIFVDQNSFYDKNGKQVCRPFIIDAVDAQRYLNYLGTQSAFILKISRYDQFIGSKKNAQSLDTQNAWKDPQSIKGLLTYDESPSGAKPEQIRPPELSASLTQQYQRAIDDMYTSTGLYPTRLGQGDGEASGVAIDARTRQGSYTTYVAFNSINRAISAGGKILNQMIPRVYDTERTITLMTAEEGRKDVVVNQQQDNYSGIIKNDLSKGTFEVRLQAGPSYEGQKAQALESLNMVLQGNPQIFNLIADLYSENLPLMNTLEIKNRLKTLVPPEILEAGKSGQMPEDQKPPTPEEQAAMADIQYKQQQIEIKKQELELKMQEAKARNEQAMLELEMKRLEVLGEIETQKLRYMAETDRTRSDNAISHADNITKILTAKIGQQDDGRSKRDR